MKSIIAKLREIMAEATDVQTMEIIYHYVSSLLLELEKLAAERKTAAKTEVERAPELPFDTAAPEGIRRSGRRVDLYRGGQLVKHCRSITEATEELHRAGFAVSRTWLGVRIADEGRAALGEYELRREAAR